MENNFLDSNLKQFQYYKLLADKSIAQLTEEQLNWQYNQQSNSIAIIIRHVSGNMLSRFTDFLTDDGEKSWRNRDAEFDPSFRQKDKLLKQWEEGWKCLFEALKELNGGDLDKIIYIRNQGHTVTEAINRQLAHSAYHVGQVVFITKMLVENWQSLSIPANASGQFNADKFAKEKMRMHFTDDVLNKDPENKQ